MDPVEMKIAGYIAENILFSQNGYPYPKDASFLEKGMVDSLNMLELVMFIEENFGIQVADQDIVPEHFDSIEKLAGFVHSKRNQVQLS